jgi:thiamine-monophosphate kinase
LNSRPIASELGLGNASDLGRLLVAANLSDLYGSGASPVALLVGAMMKRGSTTADFRDFMLGVRHQAEVQNVPVVGGDTKLGPDRVVYGVAIGEAPDSASLFLKNRGEPGDDLWVSGPLGDCNAAVVGLSRLNMRSSERDQAISSILHPSLPARQSAYVAQRRCGHGGIDISDGLGADLIRLCKSSNVGAVVDLASIPVGQLATRVALDLQLDPAIMAFGCGGDFQFLVSAHPSRRSEISDGGLFRIGQLTFAKEIFVRDRDGGRYPWPEGGHRDGRNRTFADEIWDLMSLANQVLRHRG